MMPDLTQLSDYIEKCEKHNQELRNRPEIDKEEINSNSELLSLVKGELLRVKKADKINPAIGVFGQSQCGKSFLVSELIGGREKELVIDDVDAPKFKKYNKEHTDTESTGVVTRLTYNDSRKEKLNNYVFVRFLSPLEVMWSFVNGFYHEMDYSKGFKISEKNKLLDKIASKDNSGGALLLQNKHETLAEFTECFNYINNYWLEPPLTSKAIDYLRKIAEGDNNGISVDKFVLLASTFWNCDENITKAFRARIKTLESLGFKDEGYLPEHLVKHTLDASRMGSLKLEFNADEMFVVDNGVIRSSTNQDPDNEKIRIQNLQAIVKEIELTVKNNGDNTLLTDLDVLDFPGARALSGVVAGSSSQEITNNISDDSSEIIKDMFKRGKLLYLFELYRKQYDITLLLFCSENSPPAAPILKTMLNRWIKDSEIDDNANDPGLFVAFTKSDKLLKLTDSDENKEDVTSRVEGRFNDNFSEYYKDWLDNFLIEGNTFRNFHFVRNPSAPNEAFVFINGEENFSNGYEESSKVFRQIFLNNGVVDKYLGEKKEELYNSVFYPGKDGIELLTKSIKEKFERDPERKKDSLDRAKNDIHAQIIEYKNRYYSANDVTVREKQEKEAATAFLDQLEKDPKHLPELLNGFYRTCPKAETLWTKIDELRSEGGGAGAQTIRIQSPYKEAIPYFIKRWIHLCKNQKDLHSLIGVDKNSFNKYFTKMQKYFLREDLIDPIIKDFTTYFEDVNYSSAKIIANYLSWILGEKLYYLEYQEEEVNGTPTEPIEIPDEIDFNGYIMGIWKKQLPNIYVSNFEMREPTEADKVLAEIN